MPLYCSKTGSTALREAEVQQPKTAATLSFTKSFLDFSAKVGQSLAPSSWIYSICRPNTPPDSLICLIASFSACTEPVSLIAMVPVTECRIPTVTLSSVTASPVSLTSANALPAAKPLAIDKETITLLIRLLKPFLEALWSKLEISFRHFIVRPSFS